MTLETSLRTRLAGEKETAGHDPCGLEGEPDQRHDRGSGPIHSLSMLCAMGKLHPLSESQTHHL